MIDWEKLARSETNDLRVRLLEIFDGAEAPLSPVELAGITEAKLGNVSYHVGALHDKGFVVLDHTEPRRGAVEHFYKVAKQ